MPTPPLNPAAPATFFSLFSYSPGQSQLGLSSSDHHLSGLLLLHFLLLHLCLFLSPRGTDDDNSDDDDRSSDEVPGDDDVMTRRDVVV
jgi:hypothetical protein